LAQYGQVQNILAAQAQQRAAGTQQQAAQLNLGQLQRSADYADKVQKAIVDNGGPLDSEKAAKLWMMSPDPAMAQHGYTFWQALQDKKLFENYIRSQNPNALAAPAAASATTAAPPAAPATTAESTAAPVTAESTATVPPADGSVINSSGSTPVFDRSNENLNAWIADKTTNLDFTDWINQKNTPAAPTPDSAVDPLSRESLANIKYQPVKTSAAPAQITNNLPATVAASVAPDANALALAPAPVAAANQNLPAAATTAPGAGQIAKLKQDITALSLMSDPRAKALLTMKENELKTLQTPHVIPNVGLANAAGDVFVKAPATPTNLSRLQAELTALPEGDPRRQEYINAIQKETQNAPTQLAQLIKERNNLPLGDPNRKLYDTMINKTQTEINLQQAHLKLAQDKYKQDYDQGSFKPETIDLMANLLIQTGNIPPLGMGKKAADARAQIMNRAQEISTGTGATSAQAATTMAGNKGEYAGSLSGQRAIGTQIANIQVAANEASKMINIAKPYVEKVDPSDYPTLNAVGNFVARKTGDPNITGLATSLNSLVNIYARAINPKGVGTVSDKNHAREIINDAMSRGQLNEAFTVMEQEMAAARASGPETKAAMRGGNAPAPAGVITHPNFPGFSIGKP
jgi:hypothetical protein